MLKAAGRAVPAILAAARRAVLATLAALAAARRAALAKLAAARRASLAAPAAARRASLATLAALAAARRAALAKLAAARRAALATLAAARRAALATLAAARRAVLATLAALAAARRAALAKLAAARRASLAALAAARRASLAALAALAAARRAALAALATARHAALAKLAAVRRTVLAMLAAVRRTVLAMLAAVRRTVLAMLAAVRHAVLAMLAAARRTALTTSTAVRHAAAELAAARRSDHYRAARQATASMSAAEFAAVLRRRWYVLALAGLFTLVGILAVRVRPVSYQGCGELYFAASDPGVNVYLQYDPALAPVTGMVTQTMMSQPMQQQMQARGVTDYAVTQTNTGEIRFPQYQLPTMQVCATSGSPRGTVFAAQLVTANLRSVLHQMQAAQNVPANSFITALQVTPAVPVPITGRPSLAYLGVLLIGTVAAVPLVLWSDPLFGYLERMRSAAWRGYP